MTSSHPLRLLMHVAQEQLQREGEHASLQDAAVALGRGRRRVARESEATNVQTATLQEALGVWRASGRPELEVVMNADGFTVYPRGARTHQPVVRVDLLAGASDLTEKGRLTSHVLLHPERSTVAASLLSARVLQEDLERLRSSTTAERVALVRVGWHGPLLQRRLLCELALDAPAKHQPPWVGLEGQPADILPLQRLLTHPEVVTDGTAWTAFGFPASRPFPRVLTCLQVCTSWTASWALVLETTTQEPGLLPRARTALPGILKGVQGMEQALR